MRSELTATEYAEHMQRREEIWEAMQEKVNSGTSCPTNAGRGRGRPEQFAEATEKATGQSKRNTNRATKRAREVCQQARDLIRGKEKAGHLWSGLREKGSISIHTETLAQFELRSTIRTDRVASRARARAKTPSQRR